MYVVFLIQLKNKKTHIPLSAHGEGLGVRPGWDGLHKQNLLQ